MRSVIGIFSVSGYVPLDTCWKIFTAQLTVINKERTLARPSLLDFHEPRVVEQHEVRDSYSFFIRFSLRI